MALGVRIISSRIQERNVLWQKLSLHTWEWWGQICNSRKGGSLPIQLALVLVPACYLDGLWRKDKHWKNQEGPYSLLSADVGSYLQCEERHCVLSVGPRVHRITSQYPRDIAFFFYFVFRLSKEFPLNNWFLVSDLLINIRFYGSVLF